ncbi:DEAD/DEAH box helicase family protein [Spirochaeta cellobiosiphila]|uniref:DEAD/DEAH box helicase family protein n=1 Tax=Spirochaeta cellobiosiphila TaxID=504483 RepID=UPI00041F228A|nr:DEAD/DEAH box helicase family protein [Spirochaeta cellobiosiphila]
MKSITSFADIDSLSPNDFESFVKDVFEKSGWSDAYITKVGVDFSHGDGGVDIIAYKRKRKFGIEVKQRSIKNIVGVKALNQAVTGAKLYNAEQVVLVTNSYFSSEVVQRALTLGVELVDRDNLQDMWIKKSSEIGRSDIKPRLYQKAVIDDCIEHTENGATKLLIEMATGLGKTYTSALLIKEILNIYPYKKILFLVHQLEIMNQSYIAYKNVFGIGNYSYAASVGGQLSNFSEDFSFGVVNSIYTNLPKLQKNLFDIIVIDEAHHAPANMYTQVLHYLSPKLLIGMTATPFREDGKDVFHVFGGFDGHIGKYDLVWALKNRRLAFPKYVVMLNDLNEKEISKIEKGLSLEDLDKKFFLNKKDDEVIRLIEEAVEQENIENPKAIVFCQSIEHINHLVPFFKPGTATYVHSKMASEQRRSNIRNFREHEFRYILVCDLFNEGIDIPETNILVFLRNTKSRRIWLQQLGRGLRKTPNKEYVHVFDFVGSLERINEINRLQNDLGGIKKKVESYDLDDEIIINDFIEVKYSKNAVQVLTLLEEQKWKLLPVIRAREILENYYTVNNSIPTPEKMCEELKDISTDQINTHFGSYWGYITAVFGKNESIYCDLKKRYEECCRKFKRVNTIPKPLDIIVDTRVEGLDIFDLKNIKDFSFLESDTFKQNDTTLEIENKNGSMRQEDENSFFLEIMNVFKDFKDLNKLTEEQLSYIDAEFTSRFNFLNEYKKWGESRHESN